MTQRKIPSTDDWKKPRRTKDGGTVMVPLQNKEKMFILVFLRTLDYAKAARESGIVGPEVSTDIASTVGRNVTKIPAIKEIILDQQRQQILGEEDVLSRLADQATASLSDFFKDILEILPDGTVRVVGHQLDWDMVRSKGHLIKKLTQDPQGRITIELYDAQAALTLLGKHRRLFTETLDIQETGEVIVKVVKGVSYDAL